MREQVGELADPYELEEGFRVWIGELDALCEHLLEMSCLEFDFVRLHYTASFQDDGYNPRDSYEELWTPAQYFSRVLVHALDDEYGTEQIDEMVGMNAFFGKDIR